MDNNGVHWSHRILLIIVVIMVVSLGAIYYWEPDDGLNILPTTTGKIGVIEIYGVIDDSNYAYLLSASIQEAIEDDNVKAVVLDIDSPGGVAYLTEQIYLDLLELKENKPLIACGACYTKGKAIKNG